MLHQTLVVISGRKMVDKWQKHLVITYIAMDTNMKVNLCTEMIDNAVGLHMQLKGIKSLKGAVIHSDRGSKYTSDNYRRKIAVYGLLQTENAATMQDAKVYEQE